MCWIFIYFSNSILNFFFKKNKHLKKKRTLYFCELILFFDFPYNFLNSVYNEKKFK